MELFTAEERAAQRAAQAASTVESSFDMRGALPAGSARRALDADIAAEGGKVLAGNRVILSDGSVVPYVKPAEKLRIPDWSQIDSIKHYFGSRGYQPYPSWFYHRTRDPILIKDAKEAAELGIVYRKTTDDERARFGRTDTWDWEEGCEWRPTPYRAPTLNFADHAGSKNLITGAPDPGRIQADLVSSVAAAVAKVLQITPGAAAPATVDQRQWDEFLAFQAWKKANEVVAGELAAQDASEDHRSEGDLTSNALTADQDRFLWEEEAKRLGLKVDKRWSLETLRAKVEEAMGSAA